MARVVNSSPMQPRISITFILSMNVENLLIFPLDFQILYNLASSTICYLVAVAIQIASNRHPAGASYRIILFAFPSNAADASALRR